jgi:hypothetical protein
LLHGDIDAALEASRCATDLYRARESHSLGAGLSPAHVWWWRHRALAAKADVRQADKALENRLRAAAGRHRHAERRGLRRSYLNKIDSHRAIVGAWIAHARAKRFSAKRRRRTSPERRSARAVRAPRRYGDAPQRVAQRHGTARVPGR